MSPHDALDPGRHDSRPPRQDVGALALAAAVMSNFGLDQLPVVCGDGSLAGLLSARDVDRWAAGWRPPRPAGARDSVAGP